MKRLLISFSLCLGLIQACGTSQLQKTQRMGAAQTDPNALTDEQIADLEKQQAQLEKELRDLSGESDRYSSAMSNMLAGNTEEPDLGTKTDTTDSGKGTTTTDSGKGTSTDSGKGTSTDNGKSNTPSQNNCSKKCEIIKEIIKALKSGDCEKAIDLIKQLKEENKAHKADCEKKLKDCKDKIAKAKACRNKGSDNSNGKGSDNSNGKGSDNSNGKGSDSSNGKDDNTDSKDTTQNSGSGKGKS